VVAAGSTVTKNVPPRTVVKGTPATILMTREEYEAKKKAFITARQR
jgi:acetyltransferase-like isoleucine patch superfamily enzyme